LKGLRHYKLDDSLLNLYIIDSAKMFQAKAHARIDPSSPDFKGYPLVVFYRDGKIISNMKPGTIEEIIEYS